MSKNNNEIITVEGLSKTFLIGGQKVQILKDISFSIKDGDFVIIFGPSGCGKSTLLHTILGLEPPTKGRVSFLNESVYENKTEDERNDFRKQHIGMVYQQANWIKSLNVEENVAFPLFLLGRELKASYQKAIELLKQIGMSGWAKYIPTELSSGQQQRVAMMRAIINNPSVVIADEPTGNLDYESGQMLMQYLHDINKKHEKTIIMVTHDLEYIKYAKTVIQMLDGQIVKIYGENEKEKLMSSLKTKRGVGIINGSGSSDDQDVIKKFDVQEVPKNNSPILGKNQVNTKRRFAYKNINFKKILNPKNIWNNAKKTPSLVKEFFNIWIKDTFLFMFLLMIHLTAKLLLWATSIKAFPEPIKKLYEKYFIPMYTVVLNKNRRQLNTLSRLNLIDLALKNMVFKKSRAIITIGGMALGIGAIVFLVSLGYGVNNLIIKRVAKLGEMQQADVSQQPGSQINLTDKSISDFSDITNVDHVLPLISVVARVNYNNSVSDMPVYGVTRDYLLQSAIKPSEGEIFESNTLAKAVDPEIVGQVAGVSTEINTGENGELIREVQISIDSGEWLRVREGPGTSNKIIGYTKRVEGQVLAEEYWGESYISDDGVGEKGTNDDGQPLGKWIKSDFLLWKKQSCDIDQGDCEDGKFIVARNNDNTQLQSNGYVAEIGMKVDSQIHSQGQVLGISSALDIIDVSNLASSSADLELVAIASAAGIIEETEVQRVSLANNAQQEAVVNTAMLNVLGIEKNEAIGKEFETAFIVTGAAVDGKEKIESVPSNYVITGVITDDSTPYFYVPFVDLRGLGIKNFSQVKIVTNNKDNLPKVRQQIESMGFSTNSVADTVAQIDSLFGTIRTVLAALGMVALAVASLGMFNTLTVSLLERTREVGLMKAMGMKSFEVKDLFMTESMIMGFFGGIGGIFLGFLAGKLLGLILSSFAITKGLGYIDVSHIPIIFVTTIFFLSLFVGIITGIYPAKRATKISALNALRYE